MSDRIRDWPITPIPSTSLPGILQRVGASCYEMRGATIVVAREPQGWHLSIARPDRDPTWDEIVSVRYRLLPHVPEMAMILPRLSEYVNLHRHTFHLHEVNASGVVLL